MAIYTTDDFEDGLNTLIRKAMDKKLLPHEVLMELKYKALQMEHAYYDATFKDQVQGETH